jgi:hypothetical protein
MPKPSQRSEALTTREYRLANDLYCDLRDAFSRAVAIAYPEPEKGGRGKKRNSLVTKEFSDGMLSQARTVLHEAPELVEQMIQDVIDERKDRDVEAAAHRWAAGGWAAKG